MRALSALLLALPIHLPAQDALPPEPVLEQRDGLTLVRSRAGGPALRESEAEVLDLRRIEVEGSSVVLLEWSERAGERATRWWALSLDSGASFVRVREAADRVELEAGSWDPARETLALDPRLQAPAESRLRLVQLAFQPLAATRAALERAGARVLAYVPQHAFVLRLEEPGAEERLAALPWVRALAPWHTAFRLERSAREELDGELAREARAWNVLCFEKGGEPKHELARLARRLGGRVLNPDAGARLLVLELDGAQLLELAQDDRVQFVDRWSAPEADADLALEISGGAFVHQTLGLRGEGVRGEVMDIGMRTTHVDFTPPPLVHGGPPDLQSHGTNTYGIVFGDGNQCVGGGLPEGIGVVADTGGVSNRYVHTGELVDPNLPYRCVFQSNSWGSVQTSQYTTVSADFDEMLFDFDLLVLQSQSNLGTTSSRPQAWAKNCLSVGGIRHLNTLDTADDSWTGGASVGPATDGRIKPDLAHHYDSIATTTSTTDFACTTSFCCTSAATPITAAHAGLFFQLWHQGHFGNQPGADVFESRPHMTLAKALLVANATQWDFSGATHDLRRTHQGWGRVDLRNLWENRERTFWLDQSDPLEDLETRVFLFEIGEDEPDLRIVLSWPDPPGNPAVQSQHRVNDLDLKVTAPNEKVYWGNHGLRAEMWSSPQGAPDVKDTLECVLAPAPLPGLWRVEVIASEINQDAHLATKAVDVAYSLVVIGAREPGQATPFCAGDGTASACPCGNAGLPGAGCDNSAGTGGAVLTARDQLSGAGGNGTIVLEGAGFPPAAGPTVLGIRSLAQSAGGAGAPFGDGLLCLAAPVVRVGSTTASGGAALLPLSHGAGSGTFHYQLWYRNSAPFCTPEGFNLSNGLTVVWP